MKPAEIKQWRKKRKLTQQELAELLKVSRETVARWETGVREAPNYLVYAVAYIDQNFMGD